MIINNNKLNSLPKQVEVNMENIEILANYIKEAYKTSLQLTNTSTTIAISNTNAPVDTIAGWLLDSRGLLFHITGGDGTNLLLDFYTDMKGIKGDDGATLQIDDNNTSLTKVWSSSKVASLISNGNYYTLTQPTLNGAIYEVDKTTIQVASGNNIKVGDVVFYVNNNNLDSLYNYLGDSGTNAILEKICDLSKGVKLYRHNVYLKTDPDLNTYPCSEILLTITNTQDSAMNRGQVVDYLYNKGFLANESGYYQRGRYKCADGTHLLSSSLCCSIYKICITSAKTAFVVGCHKGDSNVTKFDLPVTSFSFFDDVVEPLE